MRSAVWVLCIFAALWGVAAVMVAQVPNAWVLLPCLISVALIVVSGRVHLPERTGADAARAKKVLAWAFGIELVAIFVAANLLGHFGAQSYVLAATAAIVGLHFVPLAIGLPARVYYATGGLLVVAAAAGVMLPEPLRDLSISIAAALILWGTVASFLWTGSRLSPR
jgi:hypothetical protein